MAVCVVMLGSCFSISLVALGTASANPGSAFTTEELNFMANVDDEYAKTVTTHLVNNGRVVAGSEKSYETATWIRDQMVNEVGLSGDKVTIEDFPIVSFDVDESTAGYSVGYTSLKVDLGGSWVDIPTAQCSKGMGTSGLTYTAELVDIGEGKIADFQKLPEGALEGKIVLFTRTDVMFYGQPVITMAAERGAIAAICHFPVNPDDALKVDISRDVLPLTYISNNDAKLIRAQMALGPVTAQYVMDNKWSWEPTLTGHNVIGLIPGTELPNEYVYLGAHFDHWFTSAADDNAGVASLLATAKTIVDSGLKPKRTLVFAAFDAEEMGGWADTWFDWCMGSYAHIVKTLNGNVLHPDLPGKIVAMYNMDVIGADGTIVYVETTPDVTGFVAKAAKESGLTTAVKTWVYWPPSSYDDWQFYMMGIPCTETAFWGPTYDNLYHTTADNLDKLNWNYIHLNIDFHGLLVIRASQTAIHPYNLQENVNAINADFSTMKKRDPSIASKVDFSVYSSGLAAYSAQVSRLSAITGAKNPKVDPNLLNAKMREAALVLNPKMFDWDYTGPIPGWTGIGVFDNPSNDALHIKGAIAALDVDNGKRALIMLEKIATMQWGAYTDYAAYMSMMDYVYYIEPQSHQTWADGFMPPITNVHPEFDSIVEKLNNGDTDYGAEIASLSAKLSALYGAIQEIAVELGTALTDASIILAEVP